MVCEHIARQNTSSQHHDLCCSMKQVNGFHIGIFLRSEIRGGSRTFKGGEGTTSAKGASFVGVSGAISSRNCLKIESLKWPFPAF